jgi:hypothetical protein
MLYQAPVYVAMQIWQLQNNSSIYKVLRAGIVMLFVVLIKSDGIK